MINPFFAYLFSFGIALLVYLLGWSELYPPLRISLVAFLFVTFVIHFIMGKRIHKSEMIALKLLSKNERSPLFITLFIYLLWAMEFFYEGGIPILKIILKQPFNYRLFGIPSLHVFVVTFSSFYTVYLFQLFLSYKSKRIFLLYTINLLAALLIYSRAMLFFNLASSLFLYLIFLKHIPFKKIVFVSLTLIPLFFLFGWLGSLRVSREAKVPYNNENFMRIGKATSGFKQSIIPKEYFWAYIYISSPLANLQQNMNEYRLESFSIQNLGKMFITEVLPDFLSKRINRVFHLNQHLDKRVPGPFNVSTVYSRSYSYAGWVGLIFMASVIILLPLLFLRMLPASSDFFLSGWVILCTMYFFFAYDNNLRFTGLSFQLAYPLLLHWANKVNWARKLWSRTRIVPETGDDT
jgi:hypothetical protein